MNPIKILLLLFISYALNSYSQPGRLLLVGGGAEKNGISSWSTPAYRWAGEGKRVAIIGTSTGSLAPYFKQQCGAAFAKEFAIASHDSADSQATYDTLLTYQVIFFRGGDQYEYYNLYRNTKLQDAVNYLYNHGGTICGTSAGMNILSSIVYTAENGTVYPYESIENPNNIYVTLADDFMNLAPGYVFDPHFAERGRFGRLVGFLAYYSLNKSLDITGIGLDDMTCMTVDENGLGTVRGTGCANIYKSGSTYSLNGTKLLAHHVDIEQLLQGCTYDLNTKQTTYNTLDRSLNTFGLEETGNYTVLASGSNLLSENQDMLHELVSGTGLVSDSILILTGNETTAATFRDKLLLLGTPGVSVFSMSSETGANAELSSKITSFRKIMFVSGSVAVFNLFIDTFNGALLRNRLHNSGMISAFVGDDSRFAGKTVVDNYYQEYTSWYGELVFSKGLSLLSQSAIMPNTFYNSVMYENTATALPYAMARDTLKYGIWLTNHNFMKFTPVDGKAILTGFGAAPVMVISNEGTWSGFSTQTGTGSTGIKPRMIAGFDHLQLSLIDYTTPYVMGIVSTAGLAVEAKGLRTEISPIPAKDRLNIKMKTSSYKWEICEMSGRSLLNGYSHNELTQLDISHIKPGFYLLKTTGTESNRHYFTKFVKE